MDNKQLHAKRIRSKLGLLGLGLLLGCLAPVGTATGAEYETYVSKDKISYIKADASGSCELSVLSPEVLLPTTRAYAQYVMDSYQGWDLQPLIDLRGFVFKFVDNAPCAGLLTYYDGRSFLFFKACGKLDETELATLFRTAGEQLKLSEQLKKQSRSATR